MDPAFIRVQDALDQLTRNIASYKPFLSAESDPTYEPSTDTVTNGSYHGVSQMTNSKPSAADHVQAERTFFNPLSPNGRPLVMTTREPCDAGHKFRTVLDGEVVLSPEFRNWRPNVRIQTEISCEKAADIWMVQIPDTTANLDYRINLYRLEVMQSLLYENPYNMDLREQLIRRYEYLGYPDLASGEAYKILLLVDEVLDESGEYHQQAFSALQIHVSRRAGKTRYAASQFADDQGLRARFTSFKDIKIKIDCQVDEDEVRLWAEKIFLQLTYPMLINNLQACGCLKSAYEFSAQALQRLPHSSGLRKLQTQVLDTIQAKFELRGIPWDANIPVENYPERGVVRREVYPWNEWEPNRCSSESLAILNASMEYMAPDLEVRVAELPVLTFSGERQVRPFSSKESKMVKQLGVFAKRDIPGDELVFTEKSLITANARIHDSFCDACSKLLPDFSEMNGEEQTSCMCEECDEAVFCSLECHDLAQSSYHPALCGTAAESIATDVPATEAADALYSLLLLRVLAMAETKSIHPLGVPEMVFIWGDYNNSPALSTFKPPPMDGAWASHTPKTEEQAHGGFSRTLPWTFKANILAPLNMLERMDVNIFEKSDIYDFWVFNTLYAKFRGTASARQGRDGRPEVGAVHPIWCLANHSCDPNVKWEWDGEMRFWTKKSEERPLWKGKEKRARGGLVKGEEVLSHYCDIDLPVGERREWAAGALGPAGWLPSDCRDHIRLSNHSLASIDAFDVYYEDCPYPWVFCRHENATNTLDLMIELFGRLPVELRSYARNNIALPYIDKLSAESVNDDILLYRTTGLTTYAHEMGHIIDMHGYPANISGGQFSNSITWLAAYEKDVAVATGYSLTAQHENHSEMFVMALYDTNVPGGLQAIEPRYRDIRYQYGPECSFVHREYAYGIRYLSIERYLRNTVLKPGGICTHRWENRFVTLGVEARRTSIS
ncbi:hypothetical protein M501DRAFT_1017752 [Patellaria atrata CBS 101060]|uniref:SET domain-containing protein n=1 Tax=Patellaria atrata CBS 101060 TaxID=1346257 RepID=A0A9P4VQP0_9PEZI|nr:hypothetical protein M501DRAFT_1017752 [Patellaria atrata CBS 101060]